MIHSNTVCPACACVCDDLTVTTHDNDVSGVGAGCQLAQDWFQGNSKREPVPVQINGVRAEFETALDRAASILTDADYPLIYGLSRSSTDGQRAAIELADKLGAVIDTTASLCHGPSIMAMQNVGEVTCTLGEVRNRSDLVIFWGCNPAETHPRHAERYSVFARGRFVPEGRDGRTVVMIGDARDVENWRLDSNGALPDLVIPIETGRQFEALTTLRLLVQGQTVSNTSTHDTGASLSDLQSLADRMKSCRHGVVFFGLGLTGTSIEAPVENDIPGQANVECLLRLVAELNAFTRFFARRMRLLGDVSGADTVLCWQTGYPFSVDLSRGFPRYNPGEYSANDLLKRGDVDACLIVGSETIRAFSPASRRHLEGIPTIVFDYPATKSPFTPTVHFTTASYGLHAPGTIYRMDGIPLPLRSCLTSDTPTDEHILRRLLEMIPEPAEHAATFLPHGLMT